MHLTAMAYSRSPFRAAHHRLSMRPCGRPGHPVEDTPSPGVPLRDGGEAERLDFMDRPDRSGRFASFTDQKTGTFLLEQNASKTSKWAKFASQGHEVAWEFGANRRYTGRMLIDGEIYTPAEATKTFLQTEKQKSHG